MVTGGRYALYELSDGTSNVSSIEVLEDKVKNVSSGYTIRLNGPDNKALLLSYNNHAEHLSTEHVENRLTTETFLTVMLADKTHINKLLPPLAPIEKIEASDFDKEYSKYFKIEDSGVAVVDTGIDYTRSDLVSRALINKKEIPQNGVDDDNNGYIDDDIGFNITSHSNNTHSPDSNYHGSYVSEVATRNSAHVKVLPFKASLEIERINTSLKEAISYIRKWNTNNPNKPVRVVNLSLAQIIP